MLLTLIVLTLAWLALAQWLTGMPRLPLRLTSNSQQQLVLRASSAPALQTHVGKIIVTIEAADKALPGASVLLTRHSARWLTQDTRRDMLIEQHRDLSEMLGSGALSLRFADGSIAAIEANQLHPPLPPAFWLQGLIASLMALTALAWMLTKAPQSHKSLALMTLCQAVLVALDALGEGLGASASSRFMLLDLNLRSVAELTLVAALVQASRTHIPDAPWARRLTWSTWLAAGVLALLLMLGLLPHAWWWLQAGVQLTFTAALLMQHHSQRSQPHPWTAAGNARGCRRPRRAERGPGAPRVGAADLDGCAEHAVSGPAVHAAFAASGKGDRVLVKPGFGQPGRRAAMDRTSSDIEPVGGLVEPACSAGAGHHLQVVAVPSCVRTAELARSSVV
jgi:hypothetical protein